MVLGGKAEGEGNIGGVGGGGRGEGEGDVIHSCTTIITTAHTHTHIRFSTRQCALNLPTVLQLHTPNRDSLDWLKSTGARLPLGSGICRRCCCENHRN